MALRTMDRRSVLLSGVGATLAGCVSPRSIISPEAKAPTGIRLNPIKPLDLSVDNLSRITVCLRPFRPAGPRLETDMVNGKSVVHNYGHGGSGWSLAWGYAEGARDLAAKTRPQQVSVIGAGAIGLTSAIAIAQMGAKVTIFARDLPMDSRSARATGVWSPSSRIGFKSDVDDGFIDQWTAIARRSYARHLHYVGRAGHPVEFTPRYSVRSETREAALADVPDSGDDFLHLDGRLRDMVPQWSDVTDAPFAGDHRVRSGLALTFNITEYTHQLVEEFLALGGKFEQAEVGSLDAMALLPGDVIVNCTGFDAKALVGDETLIPVRGQIAWMPPQTDRHYGLFHRNVFLISRRDGVLIQETGGNDYFGLGNADETLSMEEFIRAQEKVTSLFEWI